jgi:excisionase family DNA binding protein
MGDSAPALYTVEEAAKLLRVGRTKAYALTQEWRATGGRSGLPVVDFGNILRVPRAALEQMLGVDLGAVPVVEVGPAADPVSAAVAELPTAALVVEPERDVVADEPAAKPASRARTRTGNRTDQLDLFDAAS